jgi:ABC-type nitrate/sulfonate/bicarbonate transport system permease component
VAGVLPVLQGLLPLVVALVICELLTPDRTPYFAPPSAWATALGDLWHSGALLPAAGATMATFLAALVVSTVLGATIGIIVGASRIGDRALGPTFEFARALPPAAIVPIAALLIGYNATMKVAVVTFAGIWPILLNTRAGVRGLDPILLDTARTLHLGAVDRARKVILPALIPAIYLGVRVAAPLALVVTLLVEILTQVEGVGALIAVAQRNYRADEVWGLILVCGLFSLLVNGLVTALERRRAA